jgi:hypothetical protein
MRIGPFDFGQLSHQSHGFVPIKFGREGMVGMHTRRDGEQSCRGRGYGKSDFHNDSPC